MRQGREYLERCPRSDNMPENLRNHIKSFRNVKVKKRQGREKGFDFKTELDKRCS
jgi:hypothetical protein